MKCIKTNYKRVKYFLSYIVDDKIKTEEIVTDNTDAMYMILARQGGVYVTAQQVCHLFPLPSDTIKEQVLVKRIQFRAKRRQAMLK